MYSIQQVPTSICLVLWGIQRKHFSHSCHQEAQRRMSYRMKQLDTEPKENNRKHYTMLNWTKLMTTKL